MIQLTEVRSLVMLVLLSACVSGCQPSRLEENEDERQIRAARDKSNKAIADRDTISLSNVWADDYHVITSRNAEATGRAANLARFRDEFSSKPDVIYIRTSDQVDVFSQWNMAAESGSWVGRWTENDERVELTGRYFAKWHKVNGHWMIRAEIFVPLNCAGEEFCKKTPVW